MGRRRLIRFLIIVGIIIAGVLVVSRQFNDRRAVGTEPFGAPQLPVMYMRIGGHRVNRMYGFSTMQDQKGARDHLTLLAADREIDLEIQAYQNRIESIRYEILSLADGSFVENGTVTNMTESRRRS